MISLKTFLPLEGDFGGKDWSITELVFEGGIVSEIVIHQAESESGIDVLEPVAKPA